MSMHSQPRSLPDCRAPRVWAVQQTFLASESQCPARLHPLPPALRDTPMASVESYSGLRNKARLLVFLLSVAQLRVPPSTLTFLRPWPRSLVGPVAGASRVASAGGECVCSSDSVPIAGSCIKLSMLIPAIVVPLTVLGAFAAYVYHQVPLLSSKSPIL